MLFLRKEAKITDTRFSEKTYCHVALPPDVDKFPETIYRFKSLADVEKYWTDLQFVCLNTPLGSFPLLNIFFSSESSSIL